MMSYMTSAVLTYRGLEWQMLLSFAFLWNSCSCIVTSPDLPLQSPSDWLASVSIITLLSGDGSCSIDSIGSKTLNLPANSRWDDMCLPAGKPVLCRFDPVIREHYTFFFSCLYLSGPQLVPAVYMLKQPAPCNFNAATYFGAMCFSCTQRTAKKQGMMANIWLSPDLRSDWFRCWINSVTFYINVSCFITLEMFRFHFIFHFEDSFTD